MSTASQTHKELAAHDTGAKEVLRIAYTAAAPRDDSASSRIARPMFELPVACFYDLPVRVQEQEKRERASLILKFGRSYQLRSRAARRSACIRKMYNAFDVIYKG